MAWYSTSVSMRKQHHRFGSVETFSVERHYDAVTSSHLKRPYNLPVLQRGSGLEATKMGSYEHCQLFSLLWVHIYYRRHTSQEKTAKLLDSKMNRAKLFLLIYIEIIIWIISAYQTTSVTEMTSCQMEFCAHISSMDDTLALLHLHLKQIKHPIV